MKIILGQPNCTKCKRLAEQHPEATYIEDVSTILLIARELGIKETPIAITTGEDAKI